MTHNLMTSGLQYKEMNMLYDTNHQSVNILEATPSRLWLFMVFDDYTWIQNKPTAV